MNVAAQRPPRVALIVAAFAVVYVVWGSTYLAIRYMVEDMPPLLAAGVRFVLAGGVLFALVQSRLREPLTWANWRAAFVIGTLLLLGGNGLVCWAETELASGLAALLIGTAPLWFTMLDWAIYGGPRPTRVTLLGLAVGSIGMYVLVGRLGFSSGPSTPLWPAIALLSACFFWALGSLHSRRAKLPQSAFLSTAMQMICGGASQILAGLIVGEGARVDVAHIGLRAWLAWGYLVVFGSLLAFSCYVWLLRHASPSKVSTYAYVNPIVAVLLGTLIGGEAFTPQMLLAAALIITAVILITSAAPRKKAAPLAAPAEAPEPRAA